MTSSDPIDLYFWPTPTAGRFRSCSRVRPPLSGEADQYRGGRAVHARISRHLPKQSHAGDRRPRRSGRNADLGVRVGRTCNISAARPASSIPPRSAAASPWRSGSTGRSAISGRWRARRIISACTHPTRFRTPSPAILTSATGLYGVMERRLARHPFLAGADYTIADIACVGWTSRWQRQGQDPDQFPHVRRWLETVRAARRTARHDPRRGSRQGRHERPRRSRRPVQSTGTVIAADYVVVAIPVPRFPIGFCAARTAMTRRFLCLTMRVARALLRPFTIGSSRRLPSFKPPVDDCDARHTWRAGARNHLGDGCTK